jgi:VWFA-related protein
MGLVSILLWAASALAQETPVFRASVNLVKLDVQALEQGRVVSDLTREDFAVFDEGTPSRIVYFGHETEPVSILLLLDVSGSMRRHLKEMAAASRKALAALRPGDQVGVMFFSRNAAIRLPFTGDFEAVAGQLARAPEEPAPGSGTQINVAILAAAEYVARALEGRPGRRAVVILTDNAGLNYQAPDEEVIRALHAADAVLNAVVTPDARPPKAPPPGRDLNPDFTPPDVFRLARATGGEVVRASSAGEAFPRIFEGIRTRYSLHCAAASGPSGTFRRLRVDLTAEARRRHPRAELRAREGYYLP